jgi:hypothetical protein
VESFFWNHSEHICYSPMGRRVEKTDIYIPHRTFKFPLFPIHWIGIGRHNEKPKTKFIELGCDKAFIGYLILLFIDCLVLLGFELMS